MLKPVSAMCLAAMALMAAALLLPGVSPAADGKKKGEELLIDVDPQGEPRGYDGLPDGPTYFLWRDGDVWHLRTKTRKLARQFSGTVKVRGGTLKLQDHAGLERNRKRRRVVDIGRVNDLNNKIDFKFRTMGREDGFDFKVSKTATAVEFDLKLDGYEHRGNIRIGRAGQSPGQAIFSLRAREPKASEGQLDSKPSKK
jgi:hypothetical protein